jgi:hypothetical protein
MAKKQVDDKALDWFPFDVVAWLTSETVRAMTNAARGVYIDLLGRQWRDGSVPSDTSKLARLCNETADSFAQIWEEVGPNFVESAPGRLINPRLEQDRTDRDNIRLAKSEAGRKGMASRWGNTPPPAEGHEYNTVITGEKQAGNGTDNRPITGDNQKEKEKEITEELSRESSTPLPPRDPEAFDPFGWDGNPAGLGEAREWLDETFGEGFGTDEVAGSWATLNRHRKQLRVKKYTSDGVKSLAVQMKREGVSPGLFCELLARVVASNWQGVGGGILTSFMAEKRRVPVQTRGQPVLTQTEDSLADAISAGARLIEKGEPLYPCR